MCGCWCIKDIIYLKRFERNGKLQDHCQDFFFSVALRPNAGHGFLILEVSRSHTTTHHSRYDSSGRMISSSQRPLRRFAAARLLRSWVLIPPGAWMFVCCECYVLSGRGLCDELITLPEESYRLWCVVVCDQETSRRRRSWPALGRSATENKTKLPYMPRTSRDIINTNVPLFSHT